MLVNALPAKTIRPGKVDTRLPTASLGITEHLGIRHPINLSNFSVPGMSCSSRAATRGKTAMMMETQP
jgi:hypothetical protein